MNSKKFAMTIESMVKEKKIPFATTYHGTYSGNDFFLKKKYNKLMTTGDNVISISKFIDNHIRYHFPECAHKLVQIDRGVDTSYFNIDSVRWYSHLTGVFPNFSESYLEVPGHKKFENYNIFFKNVQ